MILFPQVRPFRHQSPSSSVPDASLISVTCPGTSMSPDVEMISLGPAEKKLDFTESWLVDGYVILWQLKQSGGYYQKIRQLRLRGRRNLSSVCVPAVHVSFFLPWTAMSSGLYLGSVKQEDAFEAYTSASRKDERGSWILFDVRTKLQFYKWPCGLNSDSQLLENYVYTEVNTFLKSYFQISFNSLLSYLDNKYTFPRLRTRLLLPLWSRLTFFPLYLFKREFCTFYI